MFSISRFAVDLGRSGRFLASLGALLGCLAAFSAEGHSGHDHGAAGPKGASSAAPIMGLAAAEGEVFQVVLAMSEDGTPEFLIADAETNAPVNGARVVVETTSGPIGEAQPVAAGRYILHEGWPEDAHDFVVMILGGGRGDLVLVRHVMPPTLETSKEAITEGPRRWDWRIGAASATAFIVIFAVAVIVRRRWRGLALSGMALVGLAIETSPSLAHAGEDHGAPSQQAALQIGDGVTMDKATQFLLGIRTIAVQRTEMAATTRAVGRVVPDPAGHYRLHSPQPARIVFDPSLRLPSPGQAVRRGQTILAVEPAIASMERGDRQAALARIDSEIAIQEREVARLNALQGIVAGKTVETAVIRLDQLRKERVQIAGTVTGRLSLTTPLDGIVANVHVAAGDIVTPDRVLAEIVDPTRLRVEAIVHDLAVVARPGPATATTRLLPDTVFELSAIGASPRLDPGDLGVHVLFALRTDQAPRLRIGLPLDVLLPTDRRDIVITVPRDAIVEQAGRPRVFLRTAPEQFEARPVRLGDTLGPNVEVLDGLRQGERVVVQGARHLRAGR